MIIECLNGYYKFFPRSSNELSKFSNLFSISITRVDDYYTFEYLKDALNYSIEGKNYLNLTASKTCEGEIKDVFRLNNFVFDYVSNSLVLKSQIEDALMLKQGTFHFVSDKLYRAGSLYPSGEKLTGFGCMFNFENRMFNYYWFSYE